MHEQLRMAQLDIGRINDSDQSKMIKVLYPSVRGGCIYARWYDDASCILLFVDVYTAAAFQKIVFTIWRNNTLMIWHVATTHDEHAECICPLNVLPQCQVVVHTTHTHRIHMSKEINNTVRVAICILKSFDLGMVTQYAHMRYSIVQL